MVFNPSSMPTRTINRGIQPTIGTWLTARKIRIDIVHAGLSRIAPWHLRAAGLITAPTAKPRRTRCEDADPAIRGQAAIGGIVADFVCQHDRRCRFDLFRQPAKSGRGPRQAASKASGKDRPSCYIPPSESVRCNEGRCSIPTPIPAPRPQLRRRIVPSADVRTAALRSLLCRHFDAAAGDFGCLRRHNAASSPPDRARFKAVLRYLGSSQLSISTSFLIRPYCLALQPSPCSGRR